MMTLHPRDARCVNGLRSRGITLLEVKIPPFSPFVGQKVTQACEQWPPDTRLLCVARGNTALMSVSDVQLEEGDVLYLMCRDVKAVRQVLRLDR